MQTFSIITRTILTTIFILTFILRCLIADNSSDSLVGTGAAIAVLSAAKIGYKFNHFEKSIYTFSFQT